jgi:hypothetical protein
LRVSREFADRLRQRGAVADRNSAAASVKGNKTRDLAVGVSDKDRRSAGGGDAVEFARDNQSFEFWPQRDEVHISGGEAGSEQLIGLIWFEVNVGDIFCRYRTLELRVERAATDE